MRPPGVASAKATGTGLRSLLGFLYLDGQITMPLAGAVPSAACWQLAALPRAASPADLALMLGSCDRRSVAGHRDSRSCCFWHAWACAPGKSPPWSHRLQLPPERAEALGDQLALAWRVARGARLQDGDPLIPIAAARHGP
jgi:hypothetical protein